MTSIENEYDINDVVDYIINTDDIKTIALQFGTELQNEFQIEMYNLLSSKLSLSHNKDKTIFIIGDTSYGSCCCDDVTAMHVNTDLIVRVGSSCFSKNVSIPVYFLYKNIQPSLTDIDTVIAHINTITKDNNNNKTIIFYNETYKKHLITAIKAHFNSNNSNTTVYFADIEHYMNDNKHKRRLYGRVMNDVDITKDVNLVYIGNKDDCILSELTLRYAQVVKVFKLINVCDFTMDDVNNAMVNSVLYRRFNLISKCKSCNVFGILIGALALYDVNDVINEVKRTLESNNKKCYVFLLGKITEEKLANFVMFIDCFVLIACPFNSGYTNKALMKPIVSPLDIKIAFDPTYKWDSIYSFDTQFILPQHDDTNNNNNDGLNNKQTLNECTTTTTTTNTSIQTKSTNEELIPIFSAFTLDKFDQLKYKGLEITSSTTNHDNDSNTTVETIPTIKKGKRGIPIKYEKI